MPDLRGGVLDKIAISRQRNAPLNVYEAMPAQSSWEEFRLSIAADVGRIELISAQFHRRGVPPHLHDEYSISVTLRGGLAFDHRGSKHSAPSGVISCIPPGEIHNAYAARGDDWAFVSLLIPTAAVREILNDRECAANLPDLPARVVADPVMARHLMLLHERLEAGGDLLERQSACTLVLAEFFQRYSTARCQPKQLHTERDAVRRALDLLHQCYAEPVPLRRLASRAGLSPYYFLRMFRAAVGITPHVYLNQIRVMEAKRRLAAGMPAVEAAIACGFCDQSHMARQFKRAVFMTPRQYQNASSIQR
jgi:AraC-like DNA-binding protein